MIITVEEFKTLAGIDDAEHDEVIAYFVLFICSQIEDYCNQPLGIVTNKYLVFTPFRAGQRRHVLPLKKNAAELVSVEYFDEDNGEWLTKESVFLESDCDPFQLFCKNGFDLVKHRAKLNIGRPAEEIPGTLKRAAYEMVKEMVLEDGTTDSKPIFKVSSIQKSVPGGATETINFLNLAARWESILDLYRVATFD